ncbi:MAG: nicotinamide-nucleotide amidohydrolase family protein [Kiritimatiellae bacterium]|nr:nicotinamide-nucleotide amidohydrolase family protein [Kiritimatiellia bacterium]
MIRQAENLVELLKARNVTCTTAESCTGGGIAAAITDIPGSSEVFLGSVVSYANSVKSGALGVSEESLARVGAVSCEVAAQMAEGARRLMKSDIAVSTTGIAGPGGGSEEKPVGLVWFGIAGRGGTRTEKAIFAGDRESIRRQAVIHALGMLSIEAMKPKAVVFDFGGVMTTTTMPERVRNLVGELGIDWDVLERGFKKYRCLMDGDFMTLDEMYDKIWADAGIVLDETTRAKIIEEDQASFLYRNEKTLELMKSLKAAGYRLGILTNMCSNFAKLFRKHFADFVALADALVVSGEVKMYKPQKGIYLEMQRRLALPPEDIVFVDDVETNCQGARDAGWSAVRFVSAEQTASALSNL